MATSDNIDFFKSSDMEELIKINTILSWLSCKILIKNESKISRKDSKISFDSSKEALDIRSLLETIEKYLFSDSKLSMEEKLITKLKKEIVKTGGKRKVSLKEKKPYARIWAPRTLDPKIGDSISKYEYEKIWEVREKTPLIIVKSDAIKYIYVYGKTKFLSPCKFNLLEYFLRNRGQGGDIINLLDKVWGEKETAKNLRQEDNMDLIREKTSHITGTITKLNKFLLKYLEMEIKSNRKAQYRFSNFFEYYLIEII